MIVCLAACGGSQPRVLEGRDGLLVLVSGSRDSSGEANIAGELTDIGGCLGLVMGDERWAVVFPEGARLTDDGRIDLGDDGKVGMGDRIEAAGSTYGRSRSAVPEGAPAIPRNCAADRAALLAPPVKVN